MFLPMMNSDYIEVVKEASWGISRLVPMQRNVRIQSLTQMKIHQWLQSNQVPRYFLSMLTKMPVNLEPLCIFFKEWMLNDNAHIIEMRKHGGVFILNSITKKMANGQWALQPLSVMNAFVVQNIIENWARPQPSFIPSVLRVLLSQFVGNCIVDVN